ncbi:MAG: PDZ domain-containing protein [Myxococcota bacterium]
MTRGRAARGVAAGLLLACGALACGGGAPGVIHARLAYSEARGFRVLDVPPGPAARAGLAPEDRIVAIDGEPVRSMSYVEAVGRLRGPAGSEVTLTVVRGDEQRDVVVERAPPRGAGTERPAQTR